MKKLLLSLCIFCGLGATAQTVVVKLVNGQEITYQANEVSSVVFSPAQNQASLAGTYDSHLDVTIQGMPAAGTVVSEDTKFTVENTETPNKYTLSLPECKYQTMDLPAVKINDIELTKDNGDQYKIDTTFNGTDASGKTYSGTINGFITDKDTFSLSVALKYGAMPFTLNMVYSPIAK